MDRFGIGVIALILIMVIGSIVWWESRGAVVEQAGHGALATVAIEKPNLVAQGYGLDALEFWAIPTGTNVNQSGYQLLGKATLAGTDPSGMQTWLLPIPSQPMLITSIFARGFARGAPVGDAQLAVTGATSLYDALWGAATTTQATSTR